MFGLALEFSLSRPLEHRTTPLYIFETKPVPKSHLDITPQLNIKMGES